MNCLFHYLAPVAMSIALTAGVPLGAQPPESGDITAQRHHVQPFHVIYNLTLVRDGRRIEVSPSHVFRNGDQVALRLRSSRDAFVYVFNRTISGDPDEVGARSLVLQDEVRSNGADVLRGAQLIYPEPGQVARVRANASAAIPERGKALTLADPVGVEKLYVVVSPRPLNLSTLADASEGAPAQPPAGAQNDSEADVEARLSRFIAIAGNTDNWISGNESRNIVEVDNTGAVVSNGRTTPAKPVTRPATPTAGNGGAVNSAKVPRHPACSAANCASCPTCRRAAPKRAGEPILIDVSLVHRSN